MKAPNLPRLVRIGTRVWRHASVIALLEDDGRLIDPVRIIRERARTLVARARGLGWDGPPFDPRVLASLLGIRVQPDHLRAGHDACIFPRGQQLQIVFDDTRPTTRQNFSISHEIAHTLFPDGFELIRHRYQRRDAFDPDRELELLCDAGAAEILLPVDEFRADVQLDGSSLEAVHRLRERYKASREAIIRRMVQLDQSASAAIFLEFRLKPSEIAAQRQARLIESGRPSQPKLRIAYAVLSERFNVFLPSHKSIPEGSCAYRALSSGGIEDDIEQWDIAGLSRCRVQAMAMPTGDEDASLRAVALLRFLERVGSFSRWRTRERGPRS